MTCSVVNCGVRTNFLLFYLIYLYHIFFFFLLGRKTDREYTVAIKPKLATVRKYCVAVRFWTRSAGLGSPNVNRKYSFIADDSNRIQAELDWKWKRTETEHSTMYEGRHDKEPQYGTTDGLYTRERGERKQVGKLDQIRNHKTGIVELNKNTRQEKYEFCGLN